LVNTTSASVEFNQKTICKRWSNTDVSVARWVKNSVFSLAIENFKAIIIDITAEEIKE
jgi:hypothetical protein